MSNPPGPPGPREPSSSDPPSPASVTPVEGARLSPIAAIIIGLVAVGAAAAIVFLFRSGGDEAAVRSAAVPSGWTIHDLPSDGFRLGLPPEWRKVSPGDLDSLEELRRDNPDLAELIRGQLAGTPTDLIRFFAIDTRSPTLAERFATHVNVVVEPLPAGIDFRRYLDANLSQLRAIAGASFTLESDNVALPGGRSALITSVFTLPSPTGPREIAVTQYLLTKGSRGLILSMTTTSGHEATYQSLWEQIAGTFLPR